MVESLLQDLRYGFRHLRRSPGFAAAAVLTLAFGIGANTAMLTMLNALVFRPQSIRDPNGLIGITSRDGRGQVQSIPILAVAELNRDAGPFQDLCAYNGGFVISIEANGTPMQTVAAFLSGQCFSTFGVAPVHGRAIEDTDAPLLGKGSHVALISHRLWTRVYGSDPAVLGKPIKTEGIELSIVGVAPPGFGGLQVDTGVDVFAPFDTIFPVSEGRRPLAGQILGRLRPGVTLEQATAELTTRWPAVLSAAAAPALSQADRDDLLSARPELARMGTGRSSYRDRYAPALAIILGLTSGLLLLTGINLGGLLLARLTSRNTELAVRLALGGSRRRISQQMVIESLLLSLAGAALAVPMSSAITTPLVSFLPPLNVDRTLVFTPDARVLIVFTFMATAAFFLVMGLASGIVPAMRAARVDPMVALRAE
jgi:putative ABC transport system permease protein